MKEAREEKVYTDSIYTYKTGKLFSMLLEIKRVAS